MYMRVVRGVYKYLSGRGFTVIVVIVVIVVVSSSHRHVTRHRHLHFHIHPQHSARQRRVFICRHHGRQPSYSGCISPTCDSHAAACTAPQSNHARIQGCMWRGNAAGSRQNRRAMPRERCGMQKIYSGSTLRYSPR